MGSRDSMNHNQPHQCPVSSVDRKGKKVDCVLIYAQSGGYSAHAQLMLHMKQVHKQSGKIPCHAKCEYVPWQFSDGVNYGGKWMRDMKRKIQRGLIE